MTSKKRENSAEEPIGSFEDGVGALESLVAELESGELPLEKALESFERGVRLVRQLNDRLNEAERKIEILSRGPDGALTVRSQEQFAVGDSDKATGSGEPRVTAPAVSTDDDWD